ncbi:unnamed protein product [Mytilus coruscus]|uniref:DNA helicase Pif1-like 2B domain-containing protein n=1 Tax=Mytilus coruscus TaxID=42192 RepID=A0A6J8BEB1_MYTCO|nr:unnamed protein product [Mytilus coruscus]
MVGNDMLLQIHNRLNEIFGSSQPFEGIGILAFGDLYQLPPVGQSFIFQLPKDKYARLSYSFLWESFKYFELTTIVRQQGDLSFAHILNRIRDSCHTPEDVEVLKTRAISETCQPLRPENVLHVFSWNEKVDNHNTNMLSHLGEPLVELTCTENVPSSVKNYKAPSDQRLTGGLNETVRLAKKARAMLIRNVDVTIGLANGSQGTVIDFIRKNNTVVAVLVKFDSPTVGENARRDSRFDLKKKI